MAYGQGEDPGLSITPHLESVEYPATRDDIIEAAEDGEAPVEVINVLKCLPREDYASPGDVMRDLAEASRRSAMGGFEEDDGVDRDRSNIGRDLVEGASGGQTRHP